MGKLHTSRSLKITIHNQGKKFISSKTRRPAYPNNLAPNRAGDHRAWTATMRSVAVDHLLQELYVAVVSSLQSFASHLLRDSTFSVVFMLGSLWRCLDPRVAAMNCARPQIFVAATNCARPLIFVAAAMRTASTN
ncbi:Hypothetical predicted protein [Olea europaea subsp. europaea]|uniref:Uncharacterized protein n=1 Tax=Olea europaea subsp. europaea TaxID=158383 RepID=A0A8S0PHB1_OLEEU|nr:Hypothetical predicted protein [Olea europaea subsp. europaea]